MNLPDSVLACKLLNSASLDLKDRQMALASCSTLKFEDMKGASRRIYADRGKQSSNSVGPTFKEEPVFIAKIDDD